jgi:hypothetical protein
MFKKWDPVFITMGNSVLAYGSTEQKAISRAIGLSSTAVAMHIAGCVAKAVTHDGKMHVMSVHCPKSSNSPGFPEHLFSFANLASRDLFLQKLLERVSSLSDPVSSRTLDAHQVAQSSERNDEADFKMKVRVIYAPSTLFQHCLPQTHTLNKLR